MAAFARFDSRVQRAVNAARQMSFFVAAILISFAADEMERVTGELLRHIPRLSPNQFSTIQFTPWIVAIPFLISELLYLCDRLIEYPLFMYYGDKFTATQEGDFPSLQVGTSKLGFYFSATNIPILRLISICTLAALVTARETAVSSPPSLLWAMFPITLGALAAFYVRSMLIANAWQRYDVVKRRQHSVSYLFAVASSVSDLNTYSQRHSAAAITFPMWS